MGLVRSFGEQFDLKKHTQGTEVKAITYSNLQICTDTPHLPSDGAGASMVRRADTPGRHEVWVIVDI